MAGLGRAAMMASFRSDGVGQADRREGTIMFTYSLSELHMAEHTARTERVNRDGWMWKKSAPTERRHTRRQFGEALVRLGERLQGTCVGQVADGSATGYTLDAVR